MTSQRYEWEAYFNEHDCDKLTPLHHITEVFMGIETSHSNQNRET